MNSEHDLSYLRLALPDLEEFLLAKDILWPLPSAPRQIGVPGLEQLSLGNVRLCMSRLQAARQSDEIESFAAQITAFYSKWRSNWSKKAAREFSLRTNQWQRALSELRDTPSAYPREVRLRVILELLRTDVLSGDQPAESAVLEGLDQVLRGLGHTGSFVWDEGLRSAYPEQAYWFLYWTLKTVRTEHGK